MKVIHHTLYFLQKRSKTQSEGGALVVDRDVLGKGDNGI